MTKKLNENIHNWMNLHHATCEQKDKMVADVGLFASEWELQELSQEESDSRNPLYSGQSQRIKDLKKKKIWILIGPLYKLYANIKVRMILFMQSDSRDKKSRFVRLWNKITNKWKNRKSVIRKRNKVFIEQITLSEEERVKQKQETFSKDIKISVIVPLYNTPQRYLRDMIESVQQQTYANWELCLADGSDDAHEEVGRFCKEYQSKDARIRYEKLTKNEGIAGNTNKAIEMATGDYIALFDHDDMLHPAAFYYCMQEICKKNADFIYTDELTFQKDSIKNIVTLHFKPDYSPHNLNGVNYICHLCVVKKDLFKQTGLYDNHYDGSQDHDMILKLTSVAQTVVHIPQILYFWRVHPQSVSMDIGAKSYAIDAGKNAVKDNEKRLGRELDVYSSCICATHYRLEYQLKETPLVSIIIAHHESAKNLLILIDSIFERNEYDNFEIIIVDFDSRDQESKELLEILRTQENISIWDDWKMDNVNDSLHHAIDQVKGDYITFLEANMEVLDPNWMRRLLMYVSQPKVGIAAGRLVNEYGMLEEAGYIIGLGDDGVALPIEHHNNYSAPGFIGRMYYAHNVSAVSMWGMMARKEDIKKDFMLDLTSCYYAGIDFSFKQRAKGKEIVLNPYVIQLQKRKPLEGYISQDQELADNYHLQKKWAKVIEQKDPYYNPNFAKDGSFTYEYK